MLHKPGPETGEKGKPDPNPLESSLSFAVDSTSQAETDAGAALKFNLVNGNYPMPKHTDNASTSGTNSPDIPSTGAGAKWFVKGGSFQFQVQSEFAMRSA